MMAPPVPLDSLPAMRPTGAFLALTFVFMAAEYAYAKLSHHDEDHDVRETAASVGVAIGDVLIRIATSGVTALPFLFLYQHRAFDIPLNTGWTWLALFLAVEFCYYWFHRASHRVRWLWATHAVHHSATHFNLSAAIRLGWTGQLTGAFVFFLPLAWFGFHPLAIGAVIGAGLVYQFFLHSAVPYHLGPLEYILNTPTHHRVHHASNAGCLDKNFGSTLIIFDRLFGTFAAAPENETLRFGLKGRPASINPLWIALGEWVHLWRDVRKVRGLKARLQIILSAP
jgi:sterol desaturase/sphingolipid hydroxylase (fatty acid hydroxylase superfamily)